VYSSPDPVDFAYHWLRISWVEIFPGRLIDQTGDSFGHYLCCIRKIGYPIRAAVREAGPYLQVHLDSSVTGTSHIVAEESNLQPESVFDLATVTLTLSLTVHLTKDAYGFLVSRVHLRPHSAEGEPLVQRYGGRQELYVWVPNNR
jgi:hypothetical protein